MAAPGATKTVSGLAEAEVAELRAAVAAAEAAATAAVSGSGDVEERYAASLSEAGTLRATLSLC